MTDKLAKKPTSLFAGKRVGVAAQVEAAKAAFKPEEATHRIGLIFDDSGSMGGKKLDDAKEACGEFLRVCKPQDTSVALYLLDEQGKKNKPLSSDFVTLTMYIKGLDCPNGTSLWTVMDKLIHEQNITRAVIFSDGGPTDGSIPGQEGGWSNDNGAKAQAVVTAFREKKVIADTVFIGSESDTAGVATMKWIAEQTGGVFLHFTEPGLFAKNFKYLAPAFRGLLADKSFAEEIQKK